MKSKHAKTNYKIHELLHKRWSPRAFSQKTIENEKLQRIFEAARWAPSASNEQPWRFIVGEKGDTTYERIFSTLVEFNQLWAITAPVLMIAVAKNTSNKNSGNINPYANYDLGQAVAYLTFQAAAEGFFVHQMGGFDVQKAGHLFELPNDFTVVSAIALGYIGDPEVLHPNLRKMELLERERVALNELVFENAFGTPNKLVQE